MLVKEIFNSVVLICMIIFFFWWFWIGWKFIENVFIILVFIFVRVLLLFGVFVSLNVLNKL